MDGSPSGLHDRLGSLSKHESNSSRKSKEETTQPHVSDPQDSSIEHYVQRCVIIQRDEKGYGLTVSGDNPVFVQSVKEDGAAARAGVQQGDQIIKVNGTLAMQCNHQEVVRLIKSGSYVALTLARKAVQSNKSAGASQPLPSSGNAQVPHGHSVGGMGRVTSPSERITGPQPVDPEKQQQLSNARNHTIRKMLDKEKVYLEKLHSEYAKTPTEKIKNEIHSAAKRVKTLEEQLFNLPGVYFDGAPRSPRSPPPSRHVLTESESFRSALGPHHHHGRTLAHQASAPTLPKSDRSPTFQWSPSGDSPDPLMPPPSSPNHHSRGNRREAKHRHSPTQLPLSTSLENIAKPSSPKSGPWSHGGPTHSRQSSNPDALLHQVENLRQQRIDSPRTADSEGGLTRTQSEITALPPHRKTSASENFADVEVPKKRRPTNSSSRGSSLGQYDSAAESPHNTPPGTPPLTDSQTENSDMGETAETDDLSNQEEYGTPPESHVSPVGQIGRTPTQRPYIICMDDDDFPSDSEMGHLEDHGPFKSLWKLMRHQAHLAVFLYYLISNSDPSSLFFYIISDWYKEGTVKEMKKWAYEIHSTFLVPNAPLRVNNIDETILHEIDDVLQNYIEREDVLRAVFTKARNKAQEELSELLSAFRNKRTIGLGGIFGPPDYQLEEAEHDKNKELKIIESLLLHTLDVLSEDLDNANDKDFATASALATVLKQFGVKSPHATSIIDRCPTFVAKDKTRLRFLKGNKKSSLQVIAVQGHQFLPQHYYWVTYCNHCQLIIWGIGNQGYQCQNCEMNIHKACVKIVEEHCIGALRNKKDRRNNRVSEIVENIIGKNRKPSQPVPAAIERAAKLRWPEEMIEGGFASLYGDDSERPLLNRSEKQRDRADLSGGEEQYTQPLSSGNDLLDRNNGSKKGSSIGRSESFRQRRENRPSFRKRSDPNIPRSKSDVDVEDKPTNLNNSGSSSNSSLSARSLDSPSNSLEMVHRTPTGTPADSVPGSSPLVGPLSHVSSSSSSSTVHQYDDSDLEAETDPPNWQDNVEWEVIRLMKPKEKKRQDVINELFHTERTHVRNLKVLDRLFYRPLLQEQLLPPDLLHLLFSNLEEMLDIHIRFNSMMKAKRKESPVVGDIGDMMLSMFDGNSGENLKRIAANFCRNQSVALENLKSKQKKDQKLANFLAEAEAHHLCRRLQLKDIIAAGFQRLTKYPLLLENIAKYTAQNRDEYTNLLKAVECSKQILNHVNQAVEEAGNQHRLSELQRKLEKSAFEKVEHQIAHMYKNLDLTKHKLLYEGSLTWKLNKKSLEMHVVLLEDILVLLQKQDEKYVLKFHSMNLMAGREDTKLTHSPILRVQNLLPRNVATDKKGFFLVSTSEQQAIYELSANSPSDRKIWLKHITEAAEAYKRNQNSEKVRDHPMLSERTVSTEHPEELEQRTPEVTSNQNQTIQETNDAGENSDAGDHSDVSSSTMQGAPTPAESPSVPPIEQATTPSATSPDVSPQKEESSSSVQDRKSERRLQRVEILKIADGPQLIEPQEVVVSYGAVLQTAEPVLTPIERLRRKDQQIASALREKHELVADILQIPPEDFDNVAELACEMDGDKDVKELILAALYQANRLDTLVNEALRVTEEDTVSASSAEVVPDDENVLDPSSSTPSPKVHRRKMAFPSASPDKLINISTALNRQLTQLLGIITEREEERKQLQKELHNSREQIHLLHEAHRRCCVRSQSPSNQSTCHSRPNSFISIASSVSECMCDSAEPPQFLCPEDAGLQKSGMDSVPRSDCKLSNPETPIPEHFETIEESECQADDSAGEMFVDALTDAPNHQGEHCQTTDLDHDSETECKPDDPGKKEETAETVKVGDTDDQMHSDCPNRELIEGSETSSPKGINNEVVSDIQSDNVSNQDAAKPTDAVYF